MEVSIGAGFWEVEQKTALRRYSWKKRGAAVSGILHIQFHLLPNIKDEQSDCFTSMKRMHGGDYSVTTSTCTDTHSLAEHFLDATSFL